MDMVGAGLQPERTPPVTTDGSAGGHPVRVSTLAWMSAIFGIAIAWLLATISVFATPIDPMVGIGYWLFASFIAIPLGLLSGLVTLGAGLGLRWVVSRIADPRGVTAASAALIGVLCSGAGIALLMVYGPIPLAQFVWVAIASSLVGGIGLFVWSMRFAP